MRPPSPTPGVALLMLLLRSGPKRYDYATEQDEWVYSRDGRSLNDLLNQELSDALERKVDLGLTNVSTQVS